MGAGNVSPERVEPLMPVVKLVIITTFEAYARQPEGLHVITKRCLDHRG
jgi:hypothetical protein